MTVPATTLTAASSVPSAPSASTTTEPVIVVGHRNPDNDSICSAVGYAYLKNQLDTSRRYAPFRLGPLPPESVYVLNRFGIPHPEVLTHVHSRVRDVMTPEPLQITESATMRTAGELLRQHNVRTLVVHDEVGCYRGIIDTTTFANLYLAELDDAEPSLDGRLATLRSPISDFLSPDAPVLDPDDLLNEAREKVLASKLRQAVVLSERQRAIGIVTRTDLAQSPQRRVILVDHNESSQAVAGIHEAEVLEIVDHHRIGDIQTSMPIQFINLPLGSSASIVAAEYLRHGVALEAPIAAVLLSALLTDTVLLKSPTTTHRDHELAELLARAAGLDALTFGRELFEARFAGQDGSIESIVLADSKVYEQGDVSFMISQFETVNTDDLLSQERGIVDFLDGLVQQKGYEFALALITDIMKEGSQFVIAGRPHLVERGFGLDFKGGNSLWVPGILSRKKQVAPRLLD